MIFGEKVRIPSRWRFDQSRREIELRKCRLQFVLEIGAQRIASLGVLAFRPIGNPAVEFGEKLAGMKILARPGDSISSGHVFLFRSRNCSSTANVSGYDARWKWHDTDNLLC